VGDLVAQKLKLRAGDTLAFAEADIPGTWQFNVVGIVRSSDNPVVRSSIVMRWDLLNEALPPWYKDTFLSILTRVDGAERGPALSDAIDRALDAGDVTTLTMSERTVSLENLNEAHAILLAVDVGSVAILLIIALILGNTLAMSVRERASEFGVLKALG